MLDSFIVTYEQKDTYWMQKRATWKLDSPWIEPSVEVQNQPLPKSTFKITEAKDTSNGMFSWCPFMCMHLFLFCLCLFCILADMAKILAIPSFLAAFSQFRHHFLQSLQCYSILNVAETSFIGATYFVWNQCHYSRAT